MQTDTDRLRHTLAEAVQSGEGITLLTGAGISAESGIPTFRGPEGYWTVGSRNYQPHEIATRAMFQHNPREVWKWYLYRRGICQKAQPNPGHCASAKMEKLLGERFRLITQNVDGLHLRAGNSPERTYQIHGNLHHMRCARECSAAVYPIPVEIPGKARGEDLSPVEWQLLSCPACGAPARPHVLFWDEYYDEPHYRLDSSLAAAGRTRLLIVVGTAGATNLPSQIVAAVLRRGGTIVDINIEADIFAEVARHSAGGIFLQGSSSEHLPTLADLMTPPAGNRRKP